MTAKQRSRTTIDALKRQAAEFVNACRSVKDVERGPVVASLGGRSEQFGALRIAEIAHVMGRSETWVRVQAHFATPSADAAERGRYILGAIHQRALNASE